MKVTRSIAVILTLALTMFTASASAMTVEEALAIERNIPAHIGEETPSKVPTEEVPVKPNSSEVTVKRYLLCGQYLNCSLIADNKGYVAITGEWGERQKDGDKLRPGWKCVNKNGVDFETEKFESEWDIHSTFLGTHPLERLVSFDVFPGGTITFGKLNIIYKQNSNSNAKNKSSIPYDIIVDIEIYDNVSDAELGAMQLETYNYYKPSDILQTFDSVSAVDFEFTMPANVYQVLGNSTGVSISGKTLKLDISKIMNNKGGVYRFASCELASNASKYGTLVNNNGSVNGGNVNDERPTAFYDVFANAYNVDAVKWAVGQGITSGTTATTFSPNETCTTAQILTFLWRANGSTEPTISNPFTNLQTGKYYTKAALWAYEKRLISSTTFGADIPCTRSMVVTYLWKLAGSPKAGTSSFTDVPTSADYAQAVSWAVGEGITSGTGNNLFSPDAICTRGQIVTFLYRGFSN